MSRKYLHVQHIPKDEAQVPLAVPPLAVHSEGVKQVPSTPVSVVSHAPFWNLTSWKMLKKTATGHIVCYHGRENGFVTS